MNPRLLLPKSLRHKRAMVWTERAEAAEAASTHFKAMDCYLRALRWRPLDNPSELPSPSDEGGAPAPEGRDTIPCVWCGTPIPRAREGQTGTGLYCKGCA